MSEQENEKVLILNENNSEPAAVHNQGGDDFTIKLSDLQEEKEYNEQEYKEMVKLYEETLSDFVEGEVIVGKILSINDKEVAVDIGFKSEGTVPIDEFTNLDELKIGDDIEVFLDNIEDKEGQLVLSKRKADFMHVWDRIMKANENGDILQGKCMRRIKGGIVVDLLGIDAFLPGSQIDVKPIRDFDSFIGKMMDFKVVKVNNLRKNIVVSHRVLVEAELIGQRQKILDDLRKGQILEGAVKNITDFGVFIDLGGADGLLHINDLSWGRVSHPSEIVALDEKIKVMVLDFNEAKDRISLGLKQLQPHPWEKVESKYPIGVTVKGKVVNISDYGAFVELEKGVEGLIHISEMSWTQHIKHPSKILAVGEMVEAKILSIDSKDKKISLGLKQLEPDPWDLLEEKYPVGSRHIGKVRNLTNFGAFVELEEGIDGLVHISDLSWTKKIRHPGEVVKKGATIDVVVLEVDRGNRRISLGYKQTDSNPWDGFESNYKVGSLVKGKIIRLIEKGVIAELNAEVDGFIPLSHLAKKGVVRPSDGYKVGDDLELCVIEFNKEAKKIVCSEKVEYAQTLIRQKRDSGEGLESIISKDEIDEAFSLDEYSATTGQSDKREKPQEIKEETLAPVIGLPEIAADLSETETEETTEVDVKVDVVSDKETEIVRPPVEPEINTESEKKDVPLSEAETTSETGTEVTAIKEKAVKKKVASEKKVKKTTKKATPKATTKTVAKTAAKTTAKKKTGKKKEEQAEKGGE